jgi:hypothetical protein
MTGPATATQARKLGLAGGKRVALDQAPVGWTFETEPIDIELVDAGESCDIAITFVSQALELADRLDRLAEPIRPNGALWIAWPRRAGGHRSDVTEKLIREYALPLGLVDNKVAALDNDWSALRLVWRIANR